jgi:phosphohistidine phosphatase SixA
VIMLVGHMPHLAALASFFLVGSNLLRSEFGKAGVMRVSFPGLISPGAARLDWFLQPGQLRKIFRHFQPNA